MIKLLEIYNQVLSEGKNYGVLYHFVSYEGFQVNVKNHGFKFHQLEYEYADNPKYNKYGSALSTTRLYNLRWANFRFNLNGGYISSRYPIMPVHYWNISNDDKDNRIYGSKRFTHDGTPVNQYEESIFSKEMNHMMPLNNKTVFSVDIIVRDDLEERFKIELKEELAELNRLGIPYNFVTEFKPFKGVESMEPTSVKSSVKELLRLRSEEDFINYLNGRDDVREILSDVRVLSSVSSRGYLTLLKKMLDMGINLGLNDYIETSRTNTFTGMKSTSNMKVDDFIAIRSAKGNKGVLSILLQSKDIPDRIKYDIIIEYGLYEFSNSVYDGDLSNFNKLLLSIRSGNAEMFKKFFELEGMKHKFYFPVSKSNNRDIINHFLNSDGVSPEVKDKLRKVIG